MRPSIQLRSDHASRLEKLAGLRGETGISHLVDEALELFLAEEDRRRAALERTFGSIGSGTPEEILAGRRDPSD